MSIDNTIAPVNTILKGLGEVNSPGDKNNVTTSSATLTDTGIGDTLKAASTNFISVLNKAEATSIAGIKGDASTYEVASSVMEAERALKMTVAVRDKIVAAYLEISRMQI